MTVKEQRRARVLLRVLGWAIPLKEAAVIRRVSVRHACLTVGRHDDGKESWPGSGPEG